MHDTITFGHGLASYTVTEELPRICPEYGWKMDIHQDHDILLRLVPLPQPACQKSTGAC